MFHGSSLLFIVVCKIWDFFFKEAFIVILVLKYFFKIQFIVAIVKIFLVVLGLSCCARVFSSCSKRGLLFIAGLRRHCSGFSCYKAQVQVHRCSYSTACGIFLNQGSNPSPLH